MWPKYRICQLGWPMSKMQSKNEFALVLVPSTTGQWRTQTYDEIAVFLSQQNIRSWLFHHAVSDTFAWSYESYSAVRIQSRARFPGKSHSKTWRGSITPLGVSKTAPFINFSVAVVFKGEKSFLLTSWWKKKVKYRLWSGREAPLPIHRQQSGVHYIW